MHLIATHFSGDHFYWVGTLSLSFSGTVLTDVFSLWLLKLLVLLQRCNTCSWENASKRKEEYIVARRARTQCSPLSLSHHQQQPFWPPSWGKQTSRPDIKATVALWFPTSLVTPSESTTTTTTIFTTIATIAQNTRRIFSEYVNTC